MSDRSDKNKEKKGKMIMIITLKDGSVKEYSDNKTIYEIAYDLSEGLARAACAGEVDGQIKDLRTVLNKDCTLNILTANDEKGLAAYRPGSERTSSLHTAALYYAKTPADPATN